MYLIVYLYFLFFENQDFEPLLSKISHDRQKVHEKGVEEHPSSTPKNL